MPYASALSHHPVTAYAVGEVVGQVIDAAGRHPDLALLFVTLPHAGALEDAAATVQTLLEPTVLAGCASESIVGVGREVEGEAAVSLWAAWSGAVRPLRVTARQLPELVAFRGMPDPLPWEPAGFVLLADPYSFPTQDFLAEVARLHPGVPVVGGMASGARGFGGTRLALGERLFVDGAVGAVLGPGVNLATVVSQGCRPIGRALVVTDSERSVIRSLAGVPPLQRLRELTPELTPADVKAINEGGLKLGVVIDERKAVFGPGDFLLRRVLGGDRDNGAIQISDGIEIGTTAQFHVLDPAAADDELRALAAGAMDDGAPDALLLFTCNGRGRRMFAQPDHDAATLAEVFGTVPAAGMFAAGEVGPVGSRNFVHSLTASVALFREPLVSVRA